MRLFSGGRARGVTLVEVVVALALLAWLVLSVVGLIERGRRQIRSAGLTSQALAVARTVLEGMESVPFERVYGAIGCDPRAADCWVASGAPAVAAWHERAEADLPAPRLELAVQAVGDRSLEGAPALRITVRVLWMEGPRRRSVRLTTLRV